jgi:hypothetical protein
MVLLQLLIIQILFIGTLVIVNQSTSRMNQEMRVRYLIAVCKIKLEKIKSHL